MSAAPVAPCAAIALRENIVQPCVVLVRPLVGILLRGNAGAVAAVQQLAAVLGVVDQAGPVGPPGEVVAALVVRVLNVSTRRS